MANLNYVQANTLYLAGSGVVGGATSISLTALTDIYANVLTMADFGTTGYITLEPDTTNAEGATFTGITANANGTYTLTGVKTALAKTPYAETSGLVRAHAGGTKVVITDNVAFWNTFPNKKNDETIDGQWTFTNTPIVPGTVSDASTTVKGVSKLSVAPVSASNPIAVGDNDSRVTYGISQGVLSATNKLVTTDNVSIASTDLSKVVQNSTVEVGMSTSSTKKNILAQSIAPTKTKIRGVNLYKAADTGTFTGTVTVALYADLPGNPTGSALATQTITNSNWLSKAVGAFECLFTAEYSMVAGTTYWIQISTSTSDDSNHPNLGLDTAGNYGAVKYKDTTWHTVTGTLYFTTLEGINSQIVETNSSGKIPSSFVDYTTTGIPSYQQFIGMGYDNSLAIYGITSETDGSAFYLLLDDSGSIGTDAIARFARDIYSGRYYFTGSTQTSVSANGSNSIVLYGSYIYHFKDNGATFICERYDKATLGNQIQPNMPSIGAVGGDAQCFTDGVYIYLRQNATQTFYKMSVNNTSGDLTTVTTVTGGSGLGNGEQTLFTSQGEQYSINWTSVSSDTSQSIRVYKFTSPDGTAMTLNTINFSNLYGGTSANSVIGLINIGVNTMYVLNWEKTLEATTPKYSYQLILTPISKP